MQNTKAIFKERTDEIDLYFSILEKFENGSSNENINNDVFFKILKSNSILMMYNLVEAIIVSGIDEIYQLIQSCNCKYEQLNKAIKDIWLFQQVDNFIDPSYKKETYKNKVEAIIDNILKSGEILLSRDKKNGGNYDDTTIKSLCDKHGIRYNVSDEKGYLKKVKTIRNHLAHGIDSFSNCANELTVRDLRDIKTVIIKFMSEIILGMQNYYDEKAFLER